VAVADLTAAATSQAFVMTTVSAGDVIVGACVRLATDFDDGIGGITAVATIESPDNTGGNALFSTITADLVAGAGSQFGTFAAPSMGLPDPGFNPIVTAAGDVEVVVEASVNVDTLTAGSMEAFVLIARGS